MYVCVCMCMYVYVYMYMYMYVYVYVLEYIAIHHLDRGNFYIKQKLLYKSVYRVREQRPWLHCYRCVRYALVIIDGKL